MQKRIEWLFTTNHPPPDVDWLQKFPPLIAKLLWQRGISSYEQAQAYVHPRLGMLACPFLLCGMQQAVDRLFTAIDNKQRVLIYGDYDVDGVTSIALLHTLLQAYGLQAESFIPIRSLEGYGLSMAGIQRCLQSLQKQNQPQLIVCVDCGTSSHEEIAYLHAKGIEVIVLDHHEPSQAELPQVAALVNPKCQQSREWEYLCAAGVVFKVMHAMLKQRRLPNFELKHYLDLVAVATLADIVPLVHENRILVRYGLQQLGCCRHTGLRYLAKISGIEVNSPGMLAYDNVAGLPRPSSTNVGIRIGPRLNAAGRMDCPTDALALLLADCPRQAEHLAKQLHRHNTQRQHTEANIRREAIQQMLTYPDHHSCPVIVVGSPNWHPGVVGIVASFLMRTYNKPSFVISFGQDGIGKGSGRSVAGISLIEAIQSFSDIIESGGGHAMAAGICLHKDNMQLLRQRFSAWVSDNYQQRINAPCLHVDGELNFDELGLDLLNAYELLEPFGNSNALPVLCTRNVRPTEAPRRMNGGHLKLFLEQQYLQDGHTRRIEKDAIFFGAANYELPDPPWDIAYTIDRNVYRGRLSITIAIQAIRPHQG